MLLAIDVGNTQTVVGLYDGELLSDHWRVASVRTQTADELAVELHGLLSVRGRGFEDVTATVASSGVPQLAEALRQTARTHFGHDALVVASSCGCRAPTKWAPTASRTRWQPSPFSPGR